MKNVAIFGSSRAGKTTLAKKIMAKYPGYQIISGDVLVGTFARVIPQLGIDHDGGPGMRELFPEFLGSLFRRMIDGEVNGGGYVVETCDITPEQAVKYFRADDVVMIFLATPRLSAGESFAQVRRYEVDGDWTRKRSDEDLLAQRKHWVGRSRDFERECREMGIWFVDTSYDRSEVLKRVLEEMDLGE